MPRKLREFVAGGVYHVYARGNDRCRIYHDDEDYGRYLRLLERVVRHRDWSCLAYCLMPNHLHLLLSTPDPDLADGMQFVQSQYALVFNARHGRVGHLFGGRYGAKRVTTDPQLWVNAAYIAQNPVKAGLCRRPEDWRWSSHAATLRATAPAWMDDTALMAHFGAAGGEPRRRYRACVEAWRA
jgi:REP element-mobilizing transposase RayT